MASTSCGVNGGKRRNAVRKKRFIGHFLADNFQGFVDPPRIYSLQINSVDPDGRHFHGLPSNMYGVFWNFLTKRLSVSPLESPRVYSSRSLLYSLISIFTTSGKIQSIREIHDWNLFVFIGKHSFVCVSVFILFLLLLFFFYMNNFVLLFCGQKQVINAEHYHNYETGSTSRRKFNCFTSWNDYLRARSPGCAAEKVIFEGTWNRLTADGINFLS